VLRFCSFQPNARLQSDVLDSVEDLTDLPQAWTLVFYTCIAVGSTLHTMQEIRAPLVSAILFTAAKTV
jgi:hypothetical protein